MTYGSPDKSGNFFELARLLVLNAVERCMLSRTAKAINSLWSEDNPIATVVEALIARLRKKCH